MMSVRHSKRVLSRLHLAMNTTRHSPNCYQALISSSLSHQKHHYNNDNNKNNKNNNDKFDSFDFDDFDFDFDDGNKSYEFTPNNKHNNHSNNDYNNNNRNQNQNQRHNNNNNNGYNNNNNNNFQDDYQQQSSSVDPSRHNYNNNNNGRMNRGFDDERFGGRGGRGGGGDMFGSNNRHMASKRFEKVHIQWSNETLTPFRKDFYKETASVAKLSAEEVSKFRTDNAMLVFGSDIPKPFNTFDESGIPDMCLHHLHKLNIHNPTAIQQQGIPMALSGRDVVGISQTGSGKTLAYLIPLIVHISAQPVVQSGEGPIGLILAPTRELCSQINQEVSRYVRSNPDILLKHCAVYGGSDRNRQIQDLRQSPDIIVATPGRLMDLLSEGQTNFKRCTYLVFDEADRMLDMGFKDDLEVILSYVRPDRQTLMWSATWPREIESIANQFMSANKIRVQIGSTDLHANTNIEQQFKFVNHDHEKLQLFLGDIQQLCGGGAGGGEQRKKVLVFTNTKRGADQLERAVMGNAMGGGSSVRCASIHSDKSQSQRESILNGFRRNDIQVLIATDVVARGIDISDINCVVVYDFPMNIEDYVHRIGRTARGAEKGLSMAYVTRDDCQRMGTKLCQVLNKSKQEIPTFLQTKQQYGYRR